MGCGFTAVVASTALFYVSIFEVGSCLAALFLVGAILLALLNANLVLAAAVDARARL
jgi:hypothetical protein